MSQNQKAKSSKNKRIEPLRSSSRPRIGSSHRRPGLRSSHRGGAPRQAAGSPGGHTGSSSGRG